MGRATAHRDFRWLWAAQWVSVTGSTVSREAIPFTAILVLGATSLEVGVLGAAALLPGLVLGLFVGVLADRVRRRPLMIGADLLRALLVLSIPVAYLLGGLSMLQLYLVTAAVGALTVLFDVAVSSYLPGLLGPEDLLDGNSRFGISESVAEIAGPAAGGGLVQLIGGPFTLLVDAISYLVSGGLLARIRTPEPPAADPQTSDGTDWTTGMRFLWSDRRLRALLLSSGVRNLFGWFFGAVYVLFGLRVVGLGPALVGVTVAMGGVGAFVGAVLVGRLTARFGYGPVIVTGAVVSAVATGLVLAAGWPGPLGGFVLLILGQVIGDSARTAGFIDETTLRQTLTPAHLLGRVKRR